MTKDHFVGNHMSRLIYVLCAQKKRHFTQTKHVFLYNNYSIFNSYRAYSLNPLCLKFVSNKEYFEKLEREFSRFHCTWVTLLQYCPSVFPLTALMTLI